MTGPTYTRSVAFMPTATSDDGLTFEGYAAVFNSPTHITDRDGEYDEQISPGAFARTLRSGAPKFMFDHGKHPVVGNLPIGKIVDIREDAKGLYVKARMSDNWLVQPVRDAIRDRAIDGMSFRFSIPPGGDRWESRGAGKGRLRTLRDVDVVELGPVVSPAYADTTASVRAQRASTTREQRLAEARRERPTVTTTTPTPRRQYARSRNRLKRATCSA